MNWYTYANNNPLRYVDPTGLKAVEEGFDWELEEDEKSTQDNPYENVDNAFYKWLETNPHERFNMEQGLEYPDKFVMRLWYLQEREGVNLADLTIEEMDAQYLQEVKEQSYISYANALVGFAMYSYQLQMRIEGASKTDGAGSDIKFGSDTKSAQKLSNQMNKRGWTEEMVEDTVRNPYTTRVSTNKATGNSATVYYNKSGSYVVIDDVTKEVVQISDNINPSTWIPDPSIIDPYKP